MIEHHLCSQCISERIDMDRRQFLGRVAALAVIFPFGLRHRPKVNLAGEGWSKAEALAHLNGQVKPGMLPVRKPAVFPPGRDGRHFVFQEHYYA